MSGLIGTAVGTLAGIGSAIFAGAKASKAVKGVKESLKFQRSANQAWYDRKSNEDATQRADAQRMIARTEEAIKERNRAAAGASAVMGGTQESVAATKEANARAEADALSQIAVSAEGRKDALEQAYRSKDAALQGEINNMELNRAQGLAQAAQGASQAFSEFDF